MEHRQLPRKLLSLEWLGCFHKEIDIEKVSRTLRLGRKDSWDHRVGGNEAMTDDCLDLSGWPALNSPAAGAASWL